MLTEYLTETFALGPHNVPNFRGINFQVWLDPEQQGLMVTNLGNLPALIEWSAFNDSVYLLSNSPGYRAMKGSGRAGRIGSAQCPEDSVEGYVAMQTYGYQTGRWAFCRITPVAAILDYAGVCDNERGVLRLKPDWATRLGYPPPAA